MESAIQIDRSALQSFCEKHHIQRLALFGSILRDDFGPNSDIDVLVEFQSGHTPGLAFFGMEEELSKILGKKVDLNTPNFLSRHFRTKILDEAQIQYEAA